MNQWAKKLVAPIVIAVLVVLYLAGIAFIFVLDNDMPLFFRVLLIVIPIALAGVMIGVVVSRIKEIRSGEEDDLSKY